MTVTLGKQIGKVNYVHNIENGFDGFKVFFVN